MAAKFEKVSDGKYILNVCGMGCPHPQLYTKISIGKIEEGEVLEVTYDNPSSGMTIEQMCERKGDDILEKREENGKFVIAIEKG